MTVNHPGIQFLRQHLPTIARPVLAVVFVNVALIRVFRLSNYLWLCFALEVAFVPVLVVIAYLASYRRIHREAAACGAVIAPDITDRWRFGMNILEAFVGGVTGDSYPGESFERYFEKHGNTVFGRLFFDMRIVTTEPEHIKAILATDFNSFAKGQEFKDAANTLLGDGVFNADGELWKFHRAMTRPFFNKDRISHFDIFESRADEAIRLMKDRLRSGHAVDFQDVVLRFTLDSATDFLFGKCVHSLSAGLPYSPRLGVSPPVSFSLDGETRNVGNVGNMPVDPTASFANAWAAAFQKAQVQMLIRVRQGILWPLISEFWTDKLEEYMGVVDSFLDPILDEAVRRREGRRVGRESKEEEEEESENLLDHLVNLTADKKILKDETLNILLAARDTTAGLLTFVIYVLSQHPAVLARVRAEILEIVGPSRRPTYEDIPRMRYLRAVINETLRLYPLVPFNGRSCTTPTTLYNKSDPSKPIYVPKATRITYSVFLMQRRKDLWGPDADQFDPDRFLDERVHKYLTPNPFIFIPFNAGPRICLGQQFAYNESSFMLIRLLQNFDQISLAPDSQPIETLPPARWATCPGIQGRERFYPKSHLTMYAYGGLWVRLREVAEAPAE